MPIMDISRQVGEVNVSTAYTAKPEDTLIVCNATSAGFTVTLYKDLDSGAYHRLVVKISDDDVSGNTVTITDGTFSTTLASTSAAVELETDFDGDWVAVASFPTLDANTAISAADSAGLASSEAFSEADSAGLAASTATSGVDANTTTISVNKSIAASAVLSGVSATASVATSQNLSQSLLISGADSANTSQSLIISQTGSVATSQNASQSLNVSTALSVAVS
jgi:trimeric autotransporter adhesin